MKYILNTYLLLAMAFLITDDCFSQGHRGRLEAMRTAYITKKVDLTSAEAEKFWPVYNEYGEKLRSNKRELRQSYLSFRNGSGDNAEEVYQHDLKLRQAETDLHKNYSEKLKSILGVRKFIRLRIAEEEFRREMLKAMD